jgi:hypothetical protein
MPVIATFDFDPAEHYRVLRAVTQQTPWRFLPWGFVALALVMVACSVLPAWGEAEPLTLFLSALPWLVFVALWLAFIPFLQRRGARKLPETDPSARGVQERRIDTAGFHSLGNGVALDVPWHAMRRAVETDEFFLFFYNKQCAYYFPKRALSAADAAEVRALARSNLAERATLATP